MIPVIAISIRTEKPFVMTKLGALKRCRELAPLPGPRLADVAAQSFVAYADAGQVIWGPGAPADYAGVVISGRIRLVTRCGIQEERFASLRAGDSFCMAEAIEHREPKWSAIADTDCSYVKIPAALLR